MGRTVPLSRDCGVVVILYSTIARPPFRQKTLFYRSMVEPMLGMKGSLW